MLKMSDSVLQYICIHFEVSVVRGQYAKVNKKIPKGELSKFIENNTLHCDVTLSNVGDTKISQITLTPTNLPAASTHLTKSIKPGKFIQTITNPLLICISFINSSHH